MSVALSPLLAKAVIAFDTDTEADGMIAAFYAIDTDPSLLPVRTTYLPPPLYINSQTKTIISAQETTPGQTLSTADFATSMTW
ncbi:hypothetical protein Tco_0404208 [Tanacetum coccineum]